MNVITAIRSSGGSDESRRDPCTCGRARDVLRAPDHRAPDLRLRRQAAMGFGNVRNGAEVRGRTRAHEEGL
jgi:hypothetical protein